MHSIGKLSRRGFTLAELMAVVAIIAIIAGIGFGSYRKASERAVFADGLSGAHALAAAYDSYYYDNEYSYPSDMRKLDITLSKATVASGQITSRSFTFTRNNNGIKAERINGNYSIWVPLEAEGSVKVDTCTGTNAAGVEFCKSMGYSSCSSQVCSKP